MEENFTSCIKRVGGQYCCSYCNGKLIKHGKSKAHKTRFCCKVCKKTQVENYTHKAYATCLNKNIVSLTKEGMGIRSTARYLGISTNTLLKRLIHIAQNLKQPAIVKGKIFQIDELKTYIKHKNNHFWVAYALEQESKTVVSFCVGKRTNKTLKQVIKTVELSEPLKITTDKLLNYKYLISKKIHSTKHRGINHIERKNLSLRTHIKRLNRKTICFSRSLYMLSAILTIYFWG